MRTVSVVIAALALSLAGCGEATYGAAPAGVAPESARTASVPPVDGDAEPSSSFDKAPAVTVTHGATVLQLDPWTACWTGPSSSYCADGAPADDPPDLGTITDTITVDFPVDGWEFTATLRGPDGFCGVSIPVQLEPVSDRSWTMPPTGPAGAYEVDLSGGGPEGDVNATFAMRTTADGTMPAPSTDLALFYDIDGTATLFEPPTVGVQMLADPAASVTGSITVMASDGQETPIALTPAPQQCLSPGSAQLTEGGVLEPATFESVNAADRFGPAPYAIRVELVIGSVTYVATATYPDDLESQSTTIRTDFEPPLPVAPPVAYAPYVDR